jgi:hypothetical protein
MFLKKTKYKNFGQKTNEQRQAGSETDEQIGRLTEK